MTSEVWSAVAAAVVSTGILGFIVSRIFDRYLPSRKDLADMRKTSAETMKTKSESDQIDLEIHVQMSKLMDEEAKRHAHLFYKREMEYREELDRLMDKLNEARKNIEVYVIKLKEAYDRINELMDEKENTRTKN